ncbi:hypothetical protein F5884DRAFT_848191 [Xylogone sp. PMI_703]|nr:hypothetical protein F5884DRAFT_848191 [Xylogone sp. PMI_703]
MLFSGNALVTGAGSGIGRAVAIGLARNNVHALTLADLNLNGLNETERLVQEVAPSVQILKLTIDVSDKQSVDEMVLKTVQRFGSLHYAINVAGVSPSKPYSLADVPIEDYDRVCYVNARGTFLCMQAELSVIMKQQPHSPNQYSANCPPERGTIVNVASLAGIAGIMGMAPYVASKHALVGLTRCAALEYAREGIRVNSVCPSHTNTPMITDTLEMAQISNEESAVAAYYAKIAATNPSGRMAHSEEVANACIYLASGESTFINGVTLHVDGGVMSSTSFYKPL